MIIVNDPGPACPHCGRPMQVGRPMRVREYGNVCQKQLRKRYNFKRWFYCLQRHCKTVLWDEFN